MKKERKLQLTLKKMSISNLNNVIGKGGELSVDLPCPISDACLNSELCSDPGANCKTFLTVSDSIERC